MLAPGFVTVLAAVPAPPAFAAPAGWAPGFAIVLAPALAAVPLAGFPTELDF